MKYHPQKTIGTPYSQTSGRMSDNWKGSLGKVLTVNATGERHPLTVQYFNRDKEGYHPTQKPVALCEYLIKTYTDGGDVVLDNCMGFGSTGVAAVRCGRKFIGVEKEQKYFTTAQKRIKEAQDAIRLWY